MNILILHFTGTFNTAVVNTLWQIVASKKFDPDDPDLVTRII